MTATASSSNTNESSPGPGTRRLLLVAYNFPPVGGAGVQRPVKWVKNLRRLGWDVTVLTTENASVPTRDESLLTDIPEKVLVVRARTWEPDYRTKQGLVQTDGAATRGIAAHIKSGLKGLVKQAVKLALQPDPQVLWVPNALKAGRRILRDLRHDAILVTAPAYSSFFIGTALKREFGLPLVLDFRDEWDMSGRYLENAQRDWFSRVVQHRMQKHLLQRADAVVATTRASTANLGEKLKKFGRAGTRTETIYNGFDEEDFAAITSRAVDTPSSNFRFRLVYTGTLWNLTTIEPLVDAITALHQRAPNLVAKLELICVGRKTPEQSAILARLQDTGCRLELIDYCDHAKVLDWLKSTDAVCLLLSDVIGAERVVPAKLFEYLAIRKDMLAIVPRGETADIVRRYFPQGQIEPKDIAGIASWLEQRLAREHQPAAPEHVELDIHEYSRLTQTRHLVKMLDDLVQARTHQSGKAVQ